MEKEEVKDSGPPEPGSASKRSKRSSAVEPRTPLKRQRVPVQRFQSPAVEEILTPKAKGQNEERVLMFSKGSFLTVRNETESFFLCKAMQNVYKTSKTFKVQWLSLEQTPNIYKLDYFDHTELECVLCNVKMDRMAKDTYRLPHSEESRAAAVLKKALNVEKGLPINQGVEEEALTGVEPEEEEEPPEQEPPVPKKRKTESPKAKTSSATKAVKVAGSRQKVKVKGSKQKRKGETVEQKRKGPDRHLQPDPRVRVLDKDPFFETKEKLPFISKQVEGKLAIRHVLLDDMPALKSLAEDYTKVYTLDCPRSVANPKTALHYAIEKEKTGAIQLLVQDYFSPNNERMKKSTAQSVLLDTQGTGRYNYRSLGVQHIQSLTMGRGSREGNNAFTKDLNDMRGNSGVDYLKYLDSALKQGVTLDTLHHLVAVNKQVTKEELMSNVYCKVHLAVLHGHRKLAGKLIEEAEKLGGFGFNFLHKEVLCFEKADLRASILPASAKKKPYENFGMTPLHCAATNPNTKYLMKLLQVEPDYNLPDKAQRRPIHYAAVCSGTAPLELLLTRGASPHESDTQSMTPLHYACQAGRATNIEILLKKARSSSSGESDFFVQKYGIGGINRPNRASLCPIHIAVDKGYVEVVRVLIRYKVELNKPLSAGKEKLTPLMMAACRGHLDIVRILVENNATIEQPDKMKRTALIHAVMNGNAHIASYLLRMGADGNRIDSSGNSVVHYAAAYGWYFCLKLLLETTGIDANKENDWKVTPVAIAFLKGHLGLVDYLLTKAGVGIDFKDDKGMTLVSIAAASPLVPGLYEQLKFLIEDKKADTTSTDINGYTALHFLCQNNVKTMGNRWSPQLSSEATDISVKIGELLIKSGCDLNAKTGDGQTPLILAVEQANVPLVKLLLKHGSLISEEKNKDGRTLLHLMAEQCMDASMAPLLTLLAEQKVSKSKPSMKSETPQKSKVNGKGDRSSNVTPMEVTNHNEEKVPSSVQEHVSNGDSSNIKAGKSPSKAEEKVLDLKTTSKQDKALDLKMHKEDKALDLKMVSNERTLGKIDQALKKIDQQKAVEKSFQEHLEKSLQNKDSGETAKEKGQEDSNQDINSDKSPPDKLPGKDGQEKALDLKVKSEGKEKSGGNSTSEGNNVVGSKTESESVNKQSKAGSETSQIPQIARFEALTPPRAEAQKEKTYTISGKSILEKLAKVYDNEGFTPLLRACQKYKAYGVTTKQAKSGPSETVVNKYWCEGRSFIQSLLDITQADVDSVVEKKQGSSGEDQYHTEGKCCSLHFLAAAEDGASDGTESGKGLKLLLKFSPKLESVNLRGTTPLATAIQARCDQAAILLLDAGANPNVTFKPDFTKDQITTPLLMAASTSTSSVELFRKLISSGADCNFVTPENGFTAIHYIVQNTGSITTKLEKLKVLLGKGANISAQDNNGMTVLHTAVKMNNGKSDASLELEEFLITKGANLFARDKHNRLPLHYVFVNGTADDISCVDPVELTCTLTSAMKDRQLDERDVHGQTALHKAAIRGATICCMHLLQRKVDINLKDNDGNTPLSLAVLHKHDSCAIMLIQKGASVKCNIVIPNAVSPEDKTEKRPWLKWRPLKDTDKDERKEYPIFQGAIEAELEGIAHMMLDVPTEMNQLERTIAVEAALTVNKFYVALRLLKRIHDPVKFRACNSEGRSLLHILALKASPDKDPDLQLQIADLLLKNGVSPSQGDKYGCTPLIYTGLSHHFKLGHFLMEKCADIKVNHVDSFGRDVMAATFWDIQSLEGGHIDVKNWIEALQAKGCNINLLSDYPTPDPLLFGYDSFDKGEMQYFTKHSDTKLSPLILAIINCEFDLVQFMLKHGASPSFCDTHGLTPLMYAVKMNDVLMVKLLLNNTFDPDNIPTKIAGQTKLTRKMSRQLFTISALAISSTVEMPELEKEKSAEDKSDGDTDILSDTDLHQEDKSEDEEEDNFCEDELSNASEDEGSSPTNKCKKLKIKQRKKLPAVIQKLMRRQRERREYKSIEKTSDVDLSAADHRGWTVIHHLVCPLELGTYDNEEILYVLSKAGAPLLQKDSASLTPLDHALIRGAPKLTRMLQELTGIDKAKLEKPIFPSREVTDGLDLKGISLNVEEDYHKLLDDIGGEAMETDSEFIATPDDRCNIKDTGEVVLDKNQGIPYDVLLSKVDVGRGLFGTFNFYKMQIVRQKGKKMYVLFTCWGRMGEQGQFQHTPFTSLDDALKEFSKIFKSKTGNEWTQIKNFIAFPKKYRIVPVEQRRRGVKQEAINLDCSSSLPSKLPQHLQNLIKLMSSSKLYEAALSDSGLDDDIHPIGRIQKQSLLQAREILQQIAGLIRLNEDIGHSTIEDQYQQNMEKIFSLSNEYYQRVPQRGLEFEQLLPITADDTLSSELQAVNNLLDYEQASRIIMGAKYKCKEINPMDYIYKAMGCHLQVMTEDEVETQYILKYIYNSCPHCKVEAIYRVSRSKEEATMRGLNMDNHMLLWHGSGLANFISILTRGLLLAPPEAPVSGHAFGKGIYFSNSFEKSLHYCQGSNVDEQINGHNKNTKLISLCEVALGKMKESEDFGEVASHADNKHNSVVGLGEKIPDDSFDVVLPYGPVIPLGPMVSRPTASHHYYELDYNEYVVFNPAQICMRYLVQFRR